MLRVDKPELDAVLQDRLNRYQNRVNDGDYNVDQAWRNFTNTERRHKRQEGPTVRRLLAVTFHHKCAYCENRTPEEGNPIEHFEPKKLKPKKMFDWDNLLWACTTCNTGEKGRDMPYDEHNRPLFLNPSLQTDDPLCFLDIKVDPQDEHWLMVLGYMRARGDIDLARQKRAERTIQDLGLNLRNLPQDRARVIWEFLRAICDLFDPDKGADCQVSEYVLSSRESLLILLDPETPHLAAIRQILYREPAYIVDFYDTERYHCLLHALLDTIPELHPLLDAWALCPDNTTVLAPHVRTWLESQPL